MDELSEGQYGLAKNIARGTGSAVHTIASLSSFPSRVMYGSLNKLAGGPGGFGNMNPVDAEGGIEGSQFLANNGFGFFKNDPNNWELRDPVSGIVDIAMDPMTYTPAGLFTRGAKALASATGVTKVAKKIASSKPARLLTAASDYSVQGTVHRVLQPLARQFTANTERRAKEIQTEVLRMASRANKAGVSNSDLRRAAEGVATTSPLPTEIADDLLSARTVLDAQLAATQNRGGRMQPMQDPSGALYYPRKVARNSAEETVGKSVLAPTDKASGRNPLFMGFSDASEGVNDLFKDANIHALIDSKSPTSVIADEILRSYGHKIDPTYTKYTAKFPRKVDPTTGVVTGGQTSQNHYLDLAEYLKKRGLENREQGLYPNSVFSDYRQKLLKESKIEETHNLYKAAVHKLGQPIGAVNSKAGSVGLKSQLMKAGFIEKEIRKMKPHGIPYSQWSQWVMPRDAALELEKFAPRFVSPDYASEAGGMIKSGMRWAKALTLSFPQSRGRDAIGGLVQNFLMKQAGPTGYADADRIMRGGLVKGDYSKSDFVIDHLRRNNESATPENVTEALRQAIAVHLPKNRQASREFDVSDPGENLKDVLADLPGSEKKDFMDYWLKHPVKTWFGKDAPKEAPISGPLGMKSLWRGIQGTRNLKGGTVARTSYGPVLASEKVSSQTDMLNRAAGLLTRISRGEKMDEAARLVGRSQVDYGDLTAAEKVVRDYAVPFYSFNSRMLKHTLPQLLDPKSRTSRLIRGQDKLAGGDPSTPPYIESGASIPFGTLPDGTKNYITGFGMMHEPSTNTLGSLAGVGANMIGSAGNYLSSGYSGLTGDNKRSVLRERAAASNILSASDHAAELGYATLAAGNPMFSGPLQHLTGQSFFQRGEPISGLDSTTGRIARNIRQMTGLDAIPKDDTTFVDPVEYPYRGFADASLNAIMPASRLAQTGRFLTDTRGSIYDQLPKKALNLLTGVRVAGVNNKKQLSTLRDRLKNAMNKIKNVRTHDTLYVPKEDLAKMRIEDPESYKMFVDLRKQIANITKKLSGD